MMEEWRDIPGYEKLYQVSNRGNVKSLKKFKRIGNGALQPMPERVLRPAPYNKVGHLKVTLCKDGMREKAPVHKLVMLAFVGRRPEGKEIRHLNNDPQDNRVENLIYGTSSENHIDQSKQGRMGLQKLKSCDVPIIRKRLQNGETCTAIAQDYGVSMYCIFDIKRNRCFRWVRSSDA